MSVPATDAPADHDLSTRQIHAGAAEDVPQRTLTVPIYQSAAFEFPDHEAARQMFAQTRPGFTYTRTGNPTVAVLERRIADLEGGTGAVVVLRRAGPCRFVLRLLLHQLRSGSTHRVAAGHLLIPRQA